MFCELLYDSSATFAYLRCFLCTKLIICRCFGWCYFSIFMETNVTLLLFKSQQSGQLCCQFSRPNSCICDINLPFDAWIFELLGNPKSDWVEGKPNDHPWGLCNDRWSLLVCLHIVSNCLIPILSIENWHNSSLLDTFIMQEHCKWLLLAHCLDMLSFAAIVSGGKLWNLWGGFVCFQLRWVLVCRFPLPMNLVLLLHVYQTA